MKNLNRSFLNSFFGNNFGKAFGKNFDKFARIFVFAIFTFNCAPQVKTSAETTRCSESFIDLTNALTQDLPNYLNRTYTTLKIKRYALLASLPDTNPLPIKISENSDFLPPNQLFVSIRERGVPPQSYWLFFAKTTSGWRLTMAFTRINQAPVTDVSDGAIAKATNTWLRDRCN